MGDTDKIVKYINKVLDRRQLRATSENFGRAIRITGRGKDIDSGAWIRIERYGDDIIFNINSIYLNTGLRGKGILTKICEAAIGSGEINVIEVTSVVSDDMHLWCNKRNMVQDKQNMKYVYRI